MKPSLLVLTTTRWFPTARLAIAMAKAGFLVEAVCPLNHPVQTAKVVRRTYRYNGLAPLVSFTRAIRASNPDIVVPGDDLAARYLHQIHERDRSRESSSKMSALIERSLGNPENFSLLFARTGFMELARTHGVRGPETHVVSSSDDLRNCSDSFGFPLVLKANATSGGDGVRIVHSLEEAESAFSQLTSPPLLARALKRTLLDRDSALLAQSILRRQSTVNAQAFVAGTEATSAVACWNGTVLAELHFKVLQKAQSTGHATVLQSIENAEMSSAVEKMVGALKLSGLHGFDFMLQTKTGNANLIEINPRSTQAGHLTLGPGHDLPAALYAAVSGEPLYPAMRVTENNTIALFPQEWIRDVASPYLRSAYHDVPWEEAALTRACILSRRRQSAWYSGAGAKLLRNQADAPGD